MITYFLSNLYWSKTTIIIRKFCDTENNMISKDDILSEKMDYIDIGDFFYSLNKQRIVPKNIPVLNSSIPVLYLGCTDFLGICCLVFLEQSRKINQTRSSPRSRHKPFLVLIKINRNIFSAIPRENDTNTWIFRYV